MSLVCGKYIFNKECDYDICKHCGWGNDKNGATALCPFCGVDSVLPDNTIDLSEELLNEMHKVWFE
jgi:hypothetical protein